MKQNLNKTKMRHWNKTDVKVVFDINVYTGIIKA
jgi:hypothetical protein